MSEVLIRVKARCGKINSPDCGDVVCVQPDGWHWSDLELNNEFWRVVRAALIDTDITFIQAAGKGGTRRAGCLDIHSVVGSEDFTGQRNLKIIELTRQQFIAAFKVKGGAQWLLQ